MLSALGSRTDLEMELATELGTELRAELRKGLHDLGQPLTALQCRLYLGQMDGHSAEALLAAVSESMTECERVIACVRDLQTMVERGEAREAGR